MTVLLARLAAAWRVLRHGPPEEAHAGRSWTTADIRELVGRTELLLGLPECWFEQMTDAEIIEVAVVAGSHARRDDLVSNMAECALLVRSMEWAAVEAGRWPD